ncbi:DUF1800 domain-containing protein [Cognatishimia sp. F0-27]|uniref:DUF1800 domain-containing protein n=1 Tax=Cognatishimia sp. F0-27 TaxID=2816855 RepID=UPI001D0CD4BE|nr:DUF1800 domain-containing protein [Cognatishimia sp. F0-27]
MPFDPALADIRFGCGLSPVVAPPDSVRAMLDRLRQQDRAARDWPIQPWPAFSDHVDYRANLRKRLRAETDEAAAFELRKESERLRVFARKDSLKWMAAHIARRITTVDPFRERLEAFWADHFTTAGKGGLLKHGVSAFRESAIRPNMTGRFEDLLIAAVTHPMMLIYLDQTTSAGPNSEIVQGGAGSLGLNENLAREILELHTLGVDGPYTQADVRQLAELLTGLTYRPGLTRRFRPELAEPGAETVLGVSYGGAGDATLDDIDAVLRDLARHPATGWHMAAKLAVHFVGDQPEPALIVALERAWRDTGGDLMAVYEALLSHPASWSPRLSNMKQPFDFIASACRALAVPGAVLVDMPETEYRRRIHDPMVAMGQRWQAPVGPDGLEEADGAWLTPAGLAARLQWAIGVPELLLPVLPDPRAFVRTALGPFTSEATLFAARAAESRADGVGLVLAAPAFQRM